MDERILKWLFDIKIAIEEIDNFFKDSELDFLKYKDDIMLKRAVERDIENYWRSCKQNSKKGSGI